MAHSTGLQRTFILPLVLGERVLFPAGRMELRGEAWERSPVARSDVALVGVVLRRTPTANPEQPELHAIGTIARVLERNVAQATATLVGDYRFHIHRLIQRYPYPVAEVVPLPHPETDRSAAALEGHLKRLREALENYLRLVHGERNRAALVEEGWTTDPVRWAYRVAATIPLPRERQQALLEIDRLEVFLIELSRSIQAHAGRVRALRAARDIRGQREEQFGPLTPGFRWN